MIRIFARNAIRGGVCCLSLFLSFPARLVGDATAQDTPRTLVVPMRDGIELATNLYTPDEEEPPWDLILIRTPYGRGTQMRNVGIFTDRGYAVAVQDVRGQGDSGGEWSLFGFSEKTDGYDSVEWLAGQPWCTGRVGMIGGSYLGWASLWTAVAKPPHLVTVVSNVTPGDPYGQTVYNNGLLGLGNLDVIGQFTGSPRRTESEFFSESLDDLLHLPVMELDQVIHGKELPPWRQLVAHNTRDEFWADANYLEELEEVEIPIFFQGGWFDPANPGTKYNYTHARRSRSQAVKLVIGPWAHTAEASRSSGGMDFGEAAALDLPELYLRWFDHWIRGNDTGILHEPLVQIYLMGDNRWLGGDSYPLPQTSRMELRLASAGHANGVGGDGVLRLGAEGGAFDPVPYDTFTYDPDDPTPSLWHGSLVPYPAVLSDRRDVLVYQSEPLAEDITVAGPVSLRLMASTSGRDTDWVAYWRVIHPATGQPALVGGGVVRARFRESLATPELLEPGAVTEYTLDLGDIGVVLPRGAVIRLEIASAAFPRYSRNLNTGGHNEMDTVYVVAMQKVYHSAEFPSALLLTVLDPSRQ